MKILILIEILKVPLNIIFLLKDHLFKNERNNAQVLFLRTGCPSTLIVGKHEYLFRLF